MLTITRQQRRIFADASRAALAGRLGARFAIHFPVQARFSGAAALRSAAAAAIARSEALGCATERDAAFYFLLTCLMGHAIATDVRQPWAAAALSAQADTPIAARLEQLVGLANQQIDRVHGPDNGLLVRSLLRVRRLQPQDFADAGSDPARCARWLADVLPGWAKERDGDALDAVAAASPAAAQALGLDGPADIATVALHAALLGQGFASDPLYPWAGAALAGSAPGRAGRLFATALRYVDAVLA